MNAKRIVFSGSGGQGVITSAIILAETAAIHDNLNAVQTQAYGPEARGGATRADVIISEDTIHHPKVLNPNILICLTQTAYDKFCPIIRPGGGLITDTKYVKTGRKVDARQIELGMYDLVMKEIGNPIVFNICMLGTLVGLTDVVNIKSLAKVVEQKVPADFLDMNKQALDIGYQLALETGLKIQIF